MFYSSIGNTARYIFDRCGKAAHKLFAADATKKRSHIAVMSFNVQRFKGINADAEVMDAIFKKYTPDIVAFQEYDTSKTLDGVAVDTFLHRYWKYKAVGDTTIANYTKAVYSTPGLISPTTTYYTSYYESRSYQRMSTYVNGKQIAFFNTHLDYNTPYKYEQAAELLEAVSQEEYFVLLGDINTVCKSTTDADYVNIVKPFVDKGYNLSNCTEEHGFLDTWFGGTDLAGGTHQQTDNIITSANITIDRVSVDTIKADANLGLTIDHLPLVAYLTVNS